MRARASPLAVREVRGATARVATAALEAAVSWGYNLVANGMRGMGAMKSALLKCVPEGTTSASCSGVGSELPAGSMVAGSKCRRKKRDVSC